MPNKLVTFNDRDPCWMNDLSKIKSNRNTKYIKRIKKDGQNLKLQEATSLIFELISRCKDEYQNYFASKLYDPKTNAKTHWSVLITNYSACEVPIIPPHLINNKLVSNCEVKLNYFNDFFAS